MNIEQEPLVLISGLFYCSEKVFHSNVEGRKFSHAWILLGMETFKEERILFSFLSLLVISLENLQEDLVLSSLNTTRYLAFTLKIA